PISQSVNAQRQLRLTLAVSYKSRREASCRFHRVERAYRQPYLSQRCSGDLTGGIGQIRQWACERQICPGGERPHGATGINPMWLFWLFWRADARATRLA